MTDRAAQDQALVRAVLGGEETAFGELVERYQRMVAAVAWRYGAQADDVEDLVSEVFMKAYTNLGRYRPQHAFSTWLYRLAANHVMDHGRRNRRERLRSEMPAEVVDPGRSPELATAEGRRSERLRAAMAELAPHYRDAMFLVYVEGLKIEEAARELGLPIGTVKTRLMRGRNALREAMQRRFPEYFEEPDE